MSTNILPLSTTARFLATQLSSESFKPNVILPTHLIKPFLTSESSITYINKISPSNAFQRKHSFSASSTKYLQYLSWKDNYQAPITTSATPSTSSSISPTSSSPFSIIIPASQLTPIFNFESIKFIPPPNTDIIVLDPHFGQIERYMETISSHFANAGNVNEENNYPRFWSIISTHSLSYAPSWGVRHHTIGEFKISSVPFIRNTDTTGESPIQLIENSPIMKRIMNTSTLQPQYQEYFQSNLVLLEQLIVEAALCPLIYNSNDSFFSLGRLNSYLNKDIKSIIGDVVDECITVLQHHQILKDFNQGSNSNRVILNSVLSRDRLLKIILDLAKNYNSIPNLNPHSNFLNYNLRISKKQFEADQEATENSNDIHINNDNDNGNEKVMKYYRDPVRANRFIHQLGSQHGILTLKNDFVYGLLHNQL